MKLRNNLGRYLWQLCAGRLLTAKPFPDSCNREVVKIRIDSLSYLAALKEGHAYLMIEEDGYTWVWDGEIMEG